MNFIVPMLLALTGWTPNTHANTPLPADKNSDHHFAECKAKAKEDGIDLRLELRVKIEKLTPSGRPYYLEILRCEDTSANSICHSMHTSEEFDSSMVGRESNKVRAWNFYCPAFRRSINPYVLTALRFNLYEVSPWWNFTDRKVGTFSVNFGDLLRSYLPQTHSMDAQDRSVISIAIR